MNRQEVLDEVLHLSRDARLRSFKVIDIINALTTNKVVVLYSGETLNSNVPVKPNYINKVNGRMICINYGTRKSFPVATINVWNTKDIVICSNPI